MKGSPEGYRLLCYKAKMAINTRILMFYCVCKLCKCTHSFAVFPKEALYSSPKSTTGIAPNIEWCNFSLFALIKKHVAYK